MRIKRDKHDILFSKIVRKRDKYTCQRCKKQYTSNSSALHCSHFWGRSNMCTRFDEENCDALCYGCHSQWEGNKQGAYRDFKIKQLGEDGYDALEKRARSVCKKGDVLDGLYDQLKARMGELE